MPDHTEQKLHDQIKALQNVSVFAKNQYNLSPFLDQFFSTISREIGNWLFPITIDMPEHA